jgi:hypothetical protein
VPKIDVADPTSNLEALVDADLDTLATALYARADDVLKTAPELHTFRPGLAQQLTGQLLINQAGRGDGPPSRLWATIEVPVIACPSAAAPCGSSSGHVSYPAGRTRPRQMPLGGPSPLQ